MSIRRFGRFLLAYVAATLLVLPVALVGHQVAVWWHVDLSTWEIGAPLWLLVIGIPALGWGSAQLARSLGVRPKPTLQVGSWRSVPIGGVASDAARSVFPVGGSPRSLKVADDLRFCAGDVSISEADMLHFLRRCWQRQRSGRAPFSRSFWCRELDRSTYDATMSIIESAGLCVNRKAGYSGRMIFPPLTALSDLRHKLA